ncbi:MAG: sensor domain-containing diguanylate cyclase [Planctomycetaceae bacterium]|jgi:diguanylate cyclase (GGDEF)-like protein/PAS domain S-box-containing protein|nr:sensor domain-containing diguanylate cyclase [Planctomycetaceae bacterium]
MEADSVTLLRQILSGRSIPSLDNVQFENSETESICRELVTVRELLLKFSNGNLDDNIVIRGSVAGCLKTLQAHLRHLTWQVLQVAGGDFSQRVEFMGDFSQAFNSMVVQLEHSLTELKENESRLLKLNDNLQDEIRFRKTAENELKRSEERWNFAVQCSRDGIWDINLDTKEAWYSERYLEMFQYLPEDLPKDLRWDLFVHSEDSEAAEFLRKLYQNQHEECPPPFSVECRLRCHNNDYLWVRIRGMPIKEDAGYSKRIIGVTSDISLQKETETALAHRAMHDNLTGLPNRYLLDDRLRQHVANASRNGSAFIFVMMDLDNFKGVNDTLGHAAGDILLIELGKRVSACIRNTDTVARLGGDEFVFIYTCAKDKELFATEQVMQRLYQSFQTQVDLGEVMYTIRSSMGVSFFSKHATDIASLFERADEALYLAKERGKNTFAIWEPAAKEVAEKVNSEMKSGQRPTR